MDQKQNSKLSYIIGLIFILVIVGTVFFKIRSMYDFDSSKEYISHSIKDLINNNVGNNQKLIKSSVVGYSERNKGKYVVWKLKAQKTNNFFDTIVCPINFENGSKINLFVKCQFKHPLNGRVKNGQIVKVSGRLDGYSEFSKSLQLENCVLER